jgi:hypothetical protein
VTPATPNSLIVRGLISYWQVIKIEVGQHNFFSKLFTKYPRKYIPLLAKQPKVPVPLFAKQPRIYVSLILSTTAECGIRWVVPQGSWYSLQGPTRVVLTAERTVAVVAGNRDTITAAQPGNPASRIPLFWRQQCYPFIRVGGGPEGCPSSRTEVAFGRFARRSSSAPRCRSCRRAQGSR